MLITTKTTESPHTHENWKTFCWMILGQGWNKKEFQEVREFNWSENIPYQISWSTIKTALSKESKALNAFLKKFQEILYKRVKSTPKLEPRATLPAESPDTCKGPHRIPHGILRPLVSGTQLLPGGRFEHQISGYLPCKKRACLQRILCPLKLRRELASQVCL